ncbi:UNVERIFIED_CONTAM: hypothetical protein FKN15_021273 [Acipenser sinensis]
MNWILIKKEKYFEQFGVKSFWSKDFSLCHVENVSEAFRVLINQFCEVESCRSDMVKLGSNQAEKREKEQAGEDGFDNIPLITPLDVNQLHQPFPDKKEKYFEQFGVKSFWSKDFSLCHVENVSEAFRVLINQFCEVESCRSDMVKLGSNQAEKREKEQAGEDGFDNIPLITPLDVNQLHQPFPDKVIVKTTTEYQLQQKKKRKLYVPGIKKLNINLYDEVSEKVKLTGLILITMTFLACLLMLVMYKALWYDQLSCPEGFVFKHKHCTPAALEVYYSEQETGSRGSLYTAISHLNQAKKTMPELPSPWLPVINALKEAEKAKEESSRSQ